MPKTIRAVALTVVAFVALTTVPAARAAQPFGSTGCPGVRPGAWMEAPRGTVYTMGFVFKGTDAKGKAATYTTTVGNYVYPVFGQKIWKPNAGPAAYDSLGKPIGRFVYAYHTETPDFSSFGLVQLDKKVKASPQVCHFGGPTAIFDGLEATPRTVGYYGNGFPVDQVSPARTALLTGASNAENSIALGAVSLVDTGDFGAPFVADGKALGYWDSGVGAGSAGVGLVVSRLGPWIDRVQKSLKIKLTLLTAKPL